ncbi:ABC-three component system middle component 6 [Arcicella sp. DC2W]|uniref:ABC-three component system middle component 6 n=1 Tax=Arcicella gelida TaxID=2984195 RepID=A0ABU5S2L1_9BACT|nr:ABC-three component system middle component 6 [Arcicella sp. DC2W]MEA5402691.1 ABC-three component system middle component 6 [Arcicella sp. DC2W]
MIIPTDTPPERSMYVIGASVVGILKKEKAKTIDPDILYKKFIKNNPHVKITYNYFLYALDWLFILGLVELTPQAMIKRCF